VRGAGPPPDAPPRREAIHKRIDDTPADDQGLETPVTHRPTPADAPATEATPEPAAPEES
jgi:hypothetical protein